MNTDKRRSPFYDLVRYVTPYRLTLLLALLLMLATSAMTLLSPWLAGQFTLSLLGNDTLFGLTLEMILLGWLGILALQALLSFSNQYLLSNTWQQMLANLRTRVFDHLQILPLDYFQGRKHGSILTLLSNDAYLISDFVTGTLLGILPQLLTLTGAMIMILLIDPLIAVIVAILIPLFYLIMKIVGRRLRPLSQQLTEQYSETFAIAEENLKLIPVIKSFTREQLESTRFNASNQRLMLLYRQYHRIQSAITPLVQFVAAAGILLLLWITSEKYLANTIDAGELVSLLLYGMLLTRPIAWLADVYGQIQSTRGAAARLVELFSTRPEPFNTGTKTPATIEGEINFSNIGFTYPGRKQTFNNFNLQIRAGETLAITGENGSGKSTLVHLLMRFMSPDNGQITIDGIALEEYELGWLRQQIGLVQQHVLLLNGTVRDNIAYGDPDADEHDIEAAATRAHALDFIRQLPRGMDTIIGDNGVKLSGGQKQRLALARAFLKKPSILILDEATAMFDPQGEQEFIAECEDILERRTVIIITHRPASLALADRVIDLSRHQSRSL